MVIGHVLSPNKFVTGFRAEMRNIDDGGRIIGQQAQNRPRRHGFQPFAGFQNGQGTQKAQRVKGFGFMSHVPQIFAAKRSVQHAATRM